MRRADVIAIALAVAAGGTRRLGGHGAAGRAGLGALVLAGLALRARSAQYIPVCAVAPFLFWATYPDPSALLAAVALAGMRPVRAARRARAARPASDGVIAARVTLAAAMVVTASGAALVRPAAALTDRALVVWCGGDVHRHR